MKERCNDLAVWIDPPDQWNKLVRKLRWMGWEDEARWLQIAVTIGEPIKCARPWSKRGTGPALKSTEMRG